MSDMSSLSHEYASNASFAEEINDSVLKIKNVVYRTPGSEYFSEEDIKAISLKLADNLESIYRELAPEKERAKPANIQSTVIIPVDLIGRIRFKHKGTISYFLDDIKEVIGQLRSKCRLDLKGLQILDEICDIADFNASEAFGRLWRRG